MYIRQLRVKVLELTLGYMGNFFNNGSMTMKFHILNVLYDLESHAKDGRCGLSRNEDIRRFVGKWVEKQTLVFTISSMYKLIYTGLKNIWTYLVVL